MNDDEDNTGRLVAISDIDDAIAAVSTVVPKLLQLMAISPALAVNAPNVLRCLRELKAIREAVKP